MNIEKITELHTLFSRTENRIKSMEYDGEGLDIPAINELRYVGFHLLKYLISSSESELDKAVNHAKRAFYDACESSVVLHLSKIKEFEEKYQSVISISDVIKDYPDRRAKAEQARRFLQDSDRQDKISFYAEAEQHLEILENLSLVLFASKGDLDAKIRDQRKQVRRWAIGIAVGCASALLGLVTKQLGMW